MTNSITYKKAIFVKKILFLLFCFAIYNCSPDKEEVERSIRTSSEYNKAITLFENKEFDVAFNMYDELILKYPNQEWLILEKGDFYNKINDYSNALKTFNEIKDPKKLKVGERQFFLRMGLVHHKMNNLDSAIYNFKKVTAIKLIQDVTVEAIGYDYTLIGALSHLGQIYFNKKKYNKAVDYFSKAIKIQRTPAELYKRANAYYFLGNMELANNDYNESIEMVRKIYIKKNPKYNKVLCDTCGTFFGKPEYLDVLKNWRNFDEKLEETERIENSVLNDPIIKIAMDSVPKWHNEQSRLKRDIRKIHNNRILQLQDSIDKYSNKKLKTNIYD